MTSIINASTVAGVVVSPDTSGNLAIQSNGTTIATAQSTGLSISSYAPATSLITSGTAIASTSGTSIGFTSIPSWVKRITFILGGVSTTSTSQMQLQIGSGSYANTGYASGAYSPNTSNANSTTGFILMSSNTSSGNYSGNIQLTLLNSSTNLWVSSGCLGEGSNAAGNGGAHSSGGNKALSGTLDRIQITTVNGTDTFDAGSINILYE